jgi:hypothetical protein
MGIRMEYCPEPPDPAVILQAGTAGTGLNGLLMIVLQ